jgi:hypothetical protein
VASFAIAGPLGPGVKVGLQLPGCGTRAGKVASSDGRELVLEMDDELPEGALEEGSVVDLCMPLSWGMYKWLCLVSCHSGEKEAEVELLDAPMFIQRRLDPRVGVGLPAEVRLLRGAKRGEPHEALVADLSHGGLKLERARQLRTGDVVEVKLDLSATLISFTGPVTVSGRVVMAYPSAGGADPTTTDAHVKFLEGQPEAIEAIDRFVAQQLSCRWEA